MTLPQATLSELNMSDNDSLVLHITNRYLSLNKIHLHCLGDICVSDQEENVYFRAPVEKFAHCKEIRVIKNSGKYFVYPINEN